MRPRAWRHWWPRHVVEGDRPSREAVHHSPHALGILLSPCFWTGALIGTSKTERLSASGVTGRPRVVGGVEGEHVPHDQKRVLTAMRD